MNKHVTYGDSLENTRATHKLISTDRTLKRVFDAILSCLLIVAFLPVLLIIAAVVSLDGGPALFGHRRIGRNGVEFKCLKFRTMVVNGDEILAAHLKENPAAREEWLATRKLRKDPRVTFIGNLLRRSSLDELPQLLNVMRGDMSLVGPRPIVRDEIGYYSDRYCYYISVRPGLTGEWQTSGRSDTSYEARVNFDVHYVQNQSFMRDMRILLRTIPVVLTLRGSC